MARLRAALADRYRLERQLGQGGMATVYLAEDLKHKRKVALKVLRPELAAVLGAERFVQEITTTAALQHPHILPLFDSGTADGFLFYVMPFIDGETLRTKLDRETQFGIEEAVQITMAVADALDYAHRHGVVHRDIKPENILLHDGRPMVADFGIALALSAAAGGRMTETGLSLGTPHYMSPEQATAEKEITARSDVYSLGSVCYEMLAGQPPHLGGSAQQIIMKIVTDTARPLTELRKSVPHNVAAAVAKSLEKLPADRFSSAREFGEALRNPAFTVTGGTVGVAAVAPYPGRWRAIAVAASAAAVLATVAAAWLALRPTRTRPVGRYAVVLDSAAPLAYSGSSEPGRLAMTPNGRELVYVGGGRGTTRQLFLRPLASLESRPLPGTDVVPLLPAVSWDGTQVAFASFSPVGIQVASLRGGPTLTLADTGFQGPPAWGPGGYVYWVANDTLIRRMPGGGGPLEDVVVMPRPGGGSRYRWLKILPNGGGALVTEESPATGDNGQHKLHIVNLKTGRISATLQGVVGSYIPEAGALVYVAEGTLLATRFDLGSLTVKGRPIPLFNNLSMRGTQTDLAIAGGTLAYTLPGYNAEERLMWVDRSGVMTPVDTAWHDPELESYALSPDGTRLAISIRSEAARSGRAAAALNNGRMDVWVKQMDRGPVSRLTFGGDRNEAPAWTADGKYVSFSSERDGRRSLWRRRADGVGADELVADVGRNVQMADWSADGAWLVVSVAGPPSRDILAMRLGTDSILRPLLAESYDEFQPSISPDGRWLAYVSNETGAREVFVRPFPAVDQGKWQISQGGGQSPLWSPSGRELFYRSNSNTVEVADMANGPARAARRVVLRAPAGTAFEQNSYDMMFDISRDGRRFLINTAGEGDRSGDLVIVENFVTELRAALAAGNTE
jgi:eukaryotic-like serine/threonine-protein kinase